MANYSNYLTTRISNQASLSAVAYGFSEYFYYVQNQFIYSRKYRDLYRSRPSQLFFDLLIDVSTFEDKISEFFLDKEIIRDNINLYPKLENFSFKFVDYFSLLLDTNNVYNISFTEFIYLTLKNILIYRREDKELYTYAEEFKFYINSEFDSISKLDAFIEIILNNPNTKIYDLPENQIITLLNNLNKLSYNSKGLNTNLTEIPIEDWENGYLYRDIGESRNSNVNLTELILANYAGYVDGDVERMNGLGHSTPLEQDLRIDDSFKTPSMYSANSFRNKLEKFSLIGQEPGITSII